MSTTQMYAGRASYASSSPVRGHAYRTQVYLQVVAIARISGQEESEVWKWIYDQVYALYEIYLPSLPRGRNESLLRVSERHDLLDKVMLVVQAERSKWHKVEESEVD
ncbi:hypothetical protein GCM10028805_57530 [Spirosoma harenae]